MFSKYEPTITKEKQNKQRIAKDTSCPIVDLFTICFKKDNISISKNIPTNKDTVKVIKRDCQMSL